MASRRIGRSKLVYANSLLPEPLRRLDARILDCLRELEARRAGFDERVEASMWLLGEVYDAVSAGVDGLPRDVFYVMFSGGKDSLVVLDLAYRALPRRVLRVAYIEVTGNTHEENLAYTRKTVERYGLPLHHLRHTEDFYSLVERWGWPGPRRRWCMTVFKKNQANKLGRAIALTGVKWSDSSWRRRWRDAGVLGVIPGWKPVFLKPIFHWETSDVKTYIKERKLELNPLYHKLGGSGNCVYCPYNMNPDYYTRLAKYYPHWWNKLLQAEEKVEKGKPFLKPGVGKLGFRDIVELSEIKSHRLGSMLGSRFEHGVTDSTELVGLEAS